ncbi:YkgJ family cysteine cluster protein [Thermodesulfobacteriota bacterium]
MKQSQLFQDYEFLSDEADTAFSKVENEFGSCVTCKQHCSDCCNAVFGLFLIEAAYIKQHFDKLDTNIKKQALLRSDKSDMEIRQLENKLKTFENDPKMRDYTLAKERIRCPLLDDEQNCILYSFRPITCRVYGIPTAIQGKGRVCGKAQFEKGKQYPTFDLDGAYKRLYTLSKELLSDITDDDNPDKASLLISVSMAIKSPLENIIKENLA